MLAVPFVKIKFTELRIKPVLFRFYPIVPDVDTGCTTAIFHQRPLLAAIIAELRHLTCAQRKKTTVLIVHTEEIFDIQQLDKCGLSRRQIG